MGISQAFQAKQGEFFAKMGGSYESEISCHRLSLLETINLLLAEIDRDRILLGYKYKLEVPFEEELRAIFAAAGDSKTSNKTDDAFGVPLGGKIFNIRAGHGYCVLHHPVSDTKTDLRQQKSVKLDDGRVIKIHRKKTPLVLEDGLKKLRDFLGKVTDNTINVLTAEKWSDGRELIPLLAEGGGAKDAAEERLFEMGLAGEKLLINALNDPKQKRIQPTIAFTLLTLFNSQEANEAVANRIANETNNELGKQLSVVFSAVNHARIQTGHV
jgi:hypothetical protein